MRVHPGLIAIGLVAIVAVPLAIKDERDRHQREQAQQAEQRRAEYQAATETIYVKPWAQSIECGTLRHDLRACDRRYWPGQVYPDEPIPGEKAAGIVWHCEREQLDKRYPPHKVCYADASDARKKTYACPTMAVGSRLSSDKFCDRAKGLSADT